MFPNLYFFLFFFNSNKLSVTYLIIFMGWAFKIMNTVNLVSSVSENMFCVCGLSESCTASAGKISVYHSR